MKPLKPDYIFEASWEVCNMVGGIYTVLSTRAETLEKELKDRLIFIGPDIWKESESPYFEQNDDLLAEWRNDFILQTGLPLRIGRWKIHGAPVAVLVDFTPLYRKKNEIYARVWEKFGVNSIAAYGDYDEASMFGHACGIVIESYYRFFNLTSETNVIAHFNEWMTTFGEYYIQENVPGIATVFTTHATTIGRSIAGNNKPLYDYMKGYNGDQMAFELNVTSKHSTEKTAAHIADCFTTVSKITGEECAQLLDKTPHIITPNGFEDSFVPQGKDFEKRRKAARERLIKIAETLFGYSLKKDTVFISTAGRYEYKNKGIDIFVESLKNLSQREDMKSEVLAFIMVPAHILGPRPDIIEKLQNPDAYVDYWNKHTTHELYDYQNDNVISALRWFHFTNEKDEKVKVIFVPSYLNGFDGIFNMTYWDLLIGMDITVFPSYYEPWGYTPLESVAFSVPTVTTDLAGFGQWVKDNFENKKGAVALHRSDYNNSELVSAIADVLHRFTNKTKAEVKQCRETASEISKKALWEEFIEHYYQAYHIALTNKNKRLRI